MRRSRKGAPECGRRARRAVAAVGCQQDPRSPRIDCLPMPASGPSVPEMKAIKDAPSRNPSSDSLGFADKEQALEIVFPKARTTSKSPQRTGYAMARSPRDHGRSAKGAQAASGRQQHVDAPEASGCFRPQAEVCFFLGSAHHEAPGCTQAGQPKDEASERQQSKPGHRFGQHSSCGRWLEHLHLRPCRWLAARGFISRVH